MLIAQWRQRLRPPTKPVQASLPLLQKAPKAQPQQKIYFYHVVKEMEEEYFGKENQRSRLRKAVMKETRKQHLCQPTFSKGLTKVAILLDQKGPFAFIFLNDYLVTSISKQLYLLKSCPVFDKATKPSQVGGPGGTCPPTFWQIS